MDSPVRRIGFRENDERIGIMLNLVPFDADDITERVLESPLRVVRF